MPSWTGQRLITVTYANINQIRMISVKRHMRYTNDFTACLWILGNNEIGDRILSEQEIMVDHQGRQLLFGEFRYIF
jgi:hypothetical protein